MHKIYSKITKELIDSKKRILVGYLLAGYKDNETFFESMKICEEGSIDIFEIGFPSKNPYADGELIATAHSKVDYDEATSVNYWKRIRKFTKKTIWLMAYYNDFIVSGKYIDFAKEGLMDGIVIPDTDIQTRKKLQNELRIYNIDVLGFANPSMTEIDLIEVLDEFTLVYEQLYVGQTGVIQTQEMYHEMLNLTKKHGKVVAFAGFGINSHSKVKKVLDEGFDGVIIGTEILKRINISNDSLKSLLCEIKEVIT